VQLGTPDVAFSRAIEFVIEAFLGDGVRVMTGTVEIPSEIMVSRLLRQADWCEKLGSKLYSKLLRETADDVRRLGVCWAVLQGHHSDPRGSALALRFLGAVHRLVLEGKAPQLASCYPSTGGNAGCNELWPRFRSAVSEHTTMLRISFIYPFRRMK
jgi:hypothetical protein